MAYKIIRFSRKGNNKVIRRGLTESDAKLWCKRADTKKVNSKGETIWFDGYTKE